MCSHLSLADTHSNKFPIKQTWKYGHPKQYELLKGKNDVIQSLLQCMAYREQIY